MEFPVTLRKMPVYYTDQAHYLLRADDDFIKMNQLIGRQVSIKFLNQKFCSNCGETFKTLFRMGFCRECFFTSARAGESIIRPELSRAHLGEEDRDLTFEKSYQLQPHNVYLANSGGLKVGVTRADNCTTRWLDQGASEAIVFAETSNRYEAGMIEVALKEHLPDKTAWQKMLRNEDPQLDLQEEKKKAAELLSEEWRKFVTEGNEVNKLHYPVQHFPTKVKNINLDKNPEISATLQGIRGQYLIYEGGGVINIRAHSGFRVALSF